MIRLFSNFTPKRTALALAAMAVAFVAAPMALKADTGASAAPRLLTVSGEGDARAAPDQAQLSAGVVTQGKTAAEALAANSRAMSAVFAALKRLGIPEKSIQTSNFSVEPQYTPYNASNPQPARIVGYQVSNTVTVGVDDLDKVGPTLDALIASGANQAGGVSFSIRDAKPLLAQARQAAVKDAIERAETYAKAAGITLGAIVSIQEGGSQAPRPMMRMEAMAAAPAPPPPIAGGEQSVSASVTISWEIR